MPNYVSPFKSFTGLSRSLLETEPRTSYQMWQGAQGFDPFTNPRGYDYGQDLYDYFEKDYFQSGARNPGLSWLDYLDTMGGRFGDIWGALSPRQRGEQPAPRVQWASGPFGQVR